MASPLELRTNRRQTRAYIKENPTTVTFMRGAATDDGAGGVIYGDREPVDPQVVRIIQQQRAVDTERRNNDGEVTRPNVTVMCEHDADVQEGDQFPWEGVTMEVRWITDLDYELLLEVSPV